MVLEVLSVIVGLAGFGWAGWKDLKTTEFPDWLPYSMIIGALVLRGAFSFLEGDVSLLIASGEVGGLFLGFGLLMYYTKQWGDGDAWLLGAMGFLFPDSVGAVTSQLLPFPVVLLINFFFVAFAYIVVYSIAVGIQRRKTGMFFRRFRRDVLRVLAVTLGFGAALAGMFFFLRLGLQQFGSLLLFPPFLFLLLVFLQYGRFIEQTAFRKRVTVRNLQEGDVPVGEKWRVLSKKEIAALKRRGGSIWIKDGVRFAPVFALTVIAMLTVGNMWSVFLLLLPW